MLSPWHSGFHTGHSTQFIGIIFVFEKMQWPKEQHWQRSGMLNVRAFPEQLLHTTPFIPQSILVVQCTGCEVTFGRVKISKLKISQLQLHRWIVNTYFVPGTFSQMVLFLPNEAKNLRSHSWFPSCSHLNLSSIAHPISLIYKVECDPEYCSAP